MISAHSKALPPSDLQSIFDIRSILDNLLIKIHPISSYQHFNLPAILYISKLKVSDNLPISIFHSQIVM